MEKYRVRRFNTVSNDVAGPKPEKEQNLNKFS